MQIGLILPQAKMEQTIKIPPRHAAWLAQILDRSSQELDGVSSDDLRMFELYSQLFKFYGFQRYAEAFMTKDMQQLYQEATNHEN